MYVSNQSTLQNSSDNYGEELGNDTNCAGIFVVDEDNTTTTTADTSSSSCIQEDGIVHPLCGGTCHKWDAVQCMKASSQRTDTPPLPALLLPTTMVPTTMRNYNNDDTSTSDAIKHSVMMATWILYLFVYHLVVCCGS